MIISFFKKAWPLRQAFFITISILLLCACATPERLTSRAASLAKEAGFTTEILISGGFSLWTAGRDLAPANETLNIVIEGDGFAWANFYTPSENPTPLNPVGLRIASQIQAPVIYLGRPCQYITSPSCHVRYWTSDRFSDDVIQSYKTLLDIIKQRHDVRSFRVLGYSGGAYIAMRLSLERIDISEVITVAGMDTYA